MTMPPPPPLPSPIFLYQEDCLVALQRFHADSIDACVTDPPYGLKFMGKKWDYDVPHVEVWRQVFRVLKPGAHLLAFGGARTYHRMVVAIEDAGFEIRDQIQWLYGSGFPKSHNISKAIDKAAGKKRQVIGRSQHPTLKNKDLLAEKNTAAHSNNEWSREWDITASATEAAEKWEGWGTALKPANEPICLARKPFPGTVANNVQVHGTGALHIDACRIAGEDVPMNRFVDGAKPFGNGAGHEYKTVINTEGRWPANVIMDEEAGALVDEQSGLSKSTGGRANNALRSDTRVYGRGKDNVEHRDPGFGDYGGASRFFYCAKSNKKERSLGLDHENPHPTVKPVSLMRHLVRLITPPGGIVIDPYMGSGSTGVAVMLEHFRFAGIEIDPESFADAEARIQHAINS